MAQQGYGIEDIYRGVVSDVITQVREAFLDEGVDVDVLQQLKKTWESKVQTSGAVDLEGNVSKSAAQQQAIPPPSLRPTARQLQAQQIAQSSSTNQIANALANAQSADQGGMAGTSSSGIQQQQQILMAQRQLQQQRVAQKQQTQNIVDKNPAPLLGISTQLIGGTVNPVAPTTLQQLQQSGLRIMQGPDGSQYALVDGPGGSQNLILLATAANSQVGTLALDQQQIGQQLQFPAQPRPVVPHQQMIPNPQPHRPSTVAMKTEPGTAHHVPQLDGAGSINSGKDAKNKRVKIAQLDGGKGKGGPGMTDESSEEEDHDDEDPTLSAIKYAEGLEDDQNEGEVEEEEPLNSEDDQSDDEDLDTLFDADNVVVCQFEKVHRARNKWKFILKDGVMQIKGKDFCFQKCTGEAEW